jgi:hypothetical protein
MYELNYRSLLSKQYADAVALTGCKVALASLLAAVRDLGI